MGRRKKMLILSELRSSREIGVEGTLGPWSFIPPVLEALLCTRRSSSLSQKVSDYTGMPTDTWAIIQLLGQF